MDNLDKMALYAREHGMTYGQVQAGIATGMLSRAEVLSVEMKKKPVDPPNVPDDGKLHKVKGKHYYNYKGKVHTVAEWSRIYGIKKSTIWERISRGVPADFVFYHGKLRE